MFKYLMSKHRISFTSEPFKAKVVLVHLTLHPYYFHCLIIIVNIYYDNERNSGVMLNGLPPL